ncbi:SUR7/PalI family-domain-containing protein [Peziza echinospora]|nr:SUR7/PalI family-domain-containing protein [Peziza echinospora]
MLFFCLLAGVTNHNPLNRMWFLQADTSAIPGAPKLSHFTMYNVGTPPFIPRRRPEDDNDTSSFSGFRMDDNVCKDGGGGGLNYNCGKRSAAFPMLPQSYFHTDQNVPGDFLQRPKTYYYLSRFSYAFYIITLWWVLLALAACVVALLSNLATGVAAALTFVAALSMAFLASIMTAVYVMAQKAFHDSGHFARVGVKAFAFTWTSLVLICLSLTCLLAAWVYRRRRGRQSKRDSFDQSLIPSRAPGSGASYGDGGDYHEKQRGPDYYRPATSGGGAGGYGDNERGGYSREEPRRGLAGGAMVGGNRDVGVGGGGENVHLNTPGVQSAPAPAVGPVGVGRFDQEQVVRSPGIGRGTSGDTGV